MRNRDLPLLAGGPWCEYEEKTVDHALICCPRAVRIWKMADLLYGVNLRDSHTQFLLQSVEQSLDWS